VARRETGAARFALLRRLSGDMLHAACRFGLPSDAAPCCAAERATIGDHETRIDVASAQAPRSPPAGTDGFVSEEQALALGAQASLAMRHHDIVPR
jgi:hypothetical protein